MKSRGVRPLVGWSLVFVFLLSALAFFRPLSPQADHGPVSMTPSTSQDVPPGPDPLERIAPQIEEIRRIFKTPSFAIGVLHNGVRSFKAFGQADDKGRKPDENTIYGMGSCTKSFTSTVLNRLAQDGRLQLDQVPVSSKLHDLKTFNNPEVSEKMIVRDMLSHNSGLNQLIYSVVGKEGDVIASRSDVVTIFNHLPKVAEFRSEWQYNNWLFALAGVLVTRLSGKTFGSIVQDEVFNKLGMDRSYFTHPPDDNVAYPFKLPDNQPAEQRPLPAFGDGDAFDSSGSLRSCVKDMLTWANALLEAQKDKPDESSIWRRLSVTLGLQSDNTLPHELRKALKEIQKPYFPLGKDEKQQYAMGIYSYVLPTPAINTVTNFDVNNSSYVLGSDSAPRRVIGHTGDYGGFLSVFWTFPDDDLAIVVLSNTYEINGDPTNIVAQLIAQELLDLKPQVDFENVSRRIVENAKGRWTKVQSDWTSHRIAGTQPAQVDLYAGTYSGLNDALELSFEAVDSTSGSRLRMTINGRPGQVFDLYHYHHNSWTFLSDTRDDCIIEGYSPYISVWDCFVIEFHSQDEHGFQEVRWRLDEDERVEQTLFHRRNK